jgi:hypothetical protein
MASEEKIKVDLTKEELIQLVRIHTEQFLALDNVNTNDANYHFNRAAELRTVVNSLKEPF